jgi:hypothetical protein
MLLPLPLLLLFSSLLSLPSLSAIAHSNAQSEDDTPLT